MSTTVWYLNPARVAVVDETALAEDLPIEDPEQRDVLVVEDPGNCLAFVIPGDPESWLNLADHIRAAVLARQAG